MKKDFKTWLETYVFDEDHFYQCDRFEQIEILILYIEFIDQSMTRLKNSKEVEEFLELESFKSETMDFLEVLWHKN